MRATRGATVVILAATVALLATCAPSQEQRRAELEANLQLIQALRQPPPRVPPSAGQDALNARLKALEEAAKDILEILKELNQQQLQDRNRLDGHDRRLFQLEGRSP